MTTAERLQRAKEAQEAARQKRRDEDADARANIDRWLEGTIPLDLWAYARGAAKAPRSSTERARAFRARGREIPPIPPPADPWDRMICEFSALRFGLTFCMGDCPGMDEPLLKRPPSPRMERFVYDLQRKIYFGGLKHVRWPRGKGKTTWVKVVLIWCILYCHKRFPVVVEKIAGMAKVVVEEVWKRIYLTPKIAANFPEFAIPMRDVEATPQRARVQTYRGVRTDMKINSLDFHYYKFPTLQGYPNTGAIIAYRGADQAIRGININSSRPDFFFIDDPQTDTDAANPATVEKIEKNITSAVLGGGKTDQRISAVMASTPIEPDDVSETFADPKKHPEWETDTETFVVKWGDRRLADQYVELLDRADACPGSDSAEKARRVEAARKFYAEHRADIERGVEMMDDGDFDPRTEVSAYQHALWLLQTMKPRKFFAEFQMRPSRAQGLYKISPDDVSKRVNGYPFGIVPACCDRGILAFCDVNLAAGLRWEIGAFGTGRITATLAYGQYPAEGVRLVPEGIPASAVPSYLKPALKAVATTIMATRFQTEDGHDAPILGICFDGGYERKTVAEAVRELNQQVGQRLFFWSRGTSTDQFPRHQHEKACNGFEFEIVDDLTEAVYKEKMRGGDNCFTWRGVYGTHIVYNSDYYKEMSQTSYLAGPLDPSSSSFWGDSSARHFRFAQEVCAEQLVAKDHTAKRGTVYTWKKEATRPNHFGDTHAGLLAFASLTGAFDSAVAIAPKKEVYEYED
ncbi:MAG: hypothetical protein IJ173_00855 [Kiritimatiellae bacterium]|nr:hypothetical protein [Kiritimatiellia bacterium]